MSLTGFKGFSYFIYHEKNNRDLIDFYSRIPRVVPKNDRELSEEDRNYSRTLVNIFIGDRDQLVKLLMQKGLPVEFHGDAEPPMEIS